MSVYSVIRSLRREALPKGLEEFLSLRDASTHPHQILRRAIFVIDATLTAAKPARLHRGDKLL